MPAARYSIFALLAILSLALAEVHENECECVDYWLCVDGKIVTDGSNLLDVRTKQCPGVQVCCFRGDDEEPQPPITPPTSPPVVTPGPVTPPVWTPIPPVVTPEPGDNSGELQIPVVAQGQGCGRRRYPAGTIYKVTGPSDSTFYGEVPWMVVVLKQERTLIFKCGGTLIAPSLVLTAAHCVQNVSVSDLSIKAGEYDNRIVNKPIPTQSRKAKKVVIHPEFNFANLHNDIALIFLDGELQLNEVTDIVCGPDDRVDIDPKGCFVAGWGRNSSDGRYQAVLSKVSLELRDRDYCLNTLRNSRLGTRFRLHPGFICAGGGDKRDTCTGDGGGPLVCPSKKNNDKLIQMGVIAWGIGCGEGYPTVLTSVSYYLPWIQAQLS